MKKTILIPIALFFSAQSSIAAPNAVKILEAAEYIRNPQKDYRMKVLLKDSQAGKQDVRSYECLIKGRNKAIVRFLTPAVDRGTKLLMVDNQMHVSTAAAAKPIRISPRQKLAGNAAYGDVVRLNFIENYSAKWLRKDKYEGREVDVLELHAIEGRPVTYDRLEYWVEAKTSRPVRAFFQTASGRTMRESYFEDFKTVMGVQRPTKMRIVDHLQKSHVTLLYFQDTRAAELPDLLFDKQNFARDSAS
jgi:hypothetical protein